MSKTILNHADHVKIIAEKKAVGEAEHSVCVRLAARYGCGKGRIYELRHGIHTPSCCLPGGVITPAMVKKAIAKGKTSSASDELPIVGFRMWNYMKTDEGARLTSYNSNLGRWVPKETYVAACENKKHTPELVPAVIDCCGVHAYKSKTSADLLVRAADGILGAVIMTGRIRQHTLGYRAQFAKVLCFSVKPATKTGDTASQVKQDRLFWIRMKRTEELAQMYGAPVIAYEHLELYCSEFGQLI